MNGCSDGASCCAKCSGLSGALGDGERRYPAIEAILTDYVNSMVASGQSFWISADLNSAVAQSSNGFSGFGFFAEIGKAIISAATKIGTVVSNVAPAIADVVGTAQALKPVGNNTVPLTSAQIAAQIAPQIQSNLQAQGVIVPPSLYPSILNSLTAPATMPFVLGGIALVIYMAMKK